MSAQGTRSFARRSGRITVGQKRALDRLWDRYGLAFEAAPLDLDTVFGRQAPRVLDIGFGDGDALVARAAEDAGTDYLGIEIYGPGIGHCLLAAEARDLENLRIIRHDAVEVLALRVAPESIDRMNVYFPDPWPKKRHHKRRLLQPDFLSLAAGRLKPGGCLFIATDWRDYAEHIDRVAAACPALSVAERREHSGDRPLDRPTTKFERRGLRLGHRISEWRLVRERDRPATGLANPGQSTINRA